MKNFRKGICMTSTAVITAAALFAFPFPALADTSISSVSLRIDSNIEAGDSESDVDVTTSSSKFEVDDVSVTNEPDDDEEWEEDDKPKLKIKLTAEDGYYFASSFSKSKVSLSGDDADVTSVSRSSSSTLYVYVTLDALEDDDDDDDEYELEISELWWDEDSGYAYWDEAEDAKKYEVRLYRGSTALTSALTTTDSAYDFSSYITQSGTYTFRVRGVYNSSNKGDWEESDSWSVTSSDVAELKTLNRSYGYTGYTANAPQPNGAAPNMGNQDTKISSPGGAWLKDDTGWWYCNADKSYTTNGWQYIDGHWYYFNSSGYMVTGWVSWNDNWYYCGADGAMLTNAYTPDGYYVNENGIWVQ